jgi:hypothetical protein
MNCGEACRGTFGPKCKDAPLPGVDRIVEGNKTMGLSDAHDLAFQIGALTETCKGIDRAAKFIYADRLAVVEMCRESLHDRFGYVGDPGLDRLVDSALDAVKEKLK